MGEQGRRATERAHPNGASETRLCLRRKRNDRLVLTDAPLRSRGRAAVLRGRCPVRRSSQRRHDLAHWLGARTVRIPGKRPHLGQVRSFPPPDETGGLRRHAIPRLRDGDRGQGTRRRQGRLRKDRDVPAVGRADPPGGRTIPGRRSSGAGVQGRGAYRLPHHAWRHPQPLTLLSEGFHSDESWSNMSWRPSPPGGDRRLGEEALFL